MKKNTLITAMLGLILTLPVMAEVKSVSEGVVKSASIGTQANGYFDIQIDPTTDVGKVIYYDGRVVSSAERCNTAISGTMRVGIMVTDDVGQVEYHVAGTTKTKWESVKKVGNQYHCGVAEEIWTYNGVGRYEAFFERTGYATEKELITYIPACRSNELLDLYAQRRPRDTNFYMTTDLAAYNNMQSALGFNETYGVIGKTLKWGKYNGGKEVTAFMNRYNNDRMTTYAASIDSSEMNTHPNWRVDGGLGYIYTKPYNGTIPLYRGYGVYNDGHDWEVGITTNYYHMQSMLSQGWQPLGTIGNPQAVLGYVCPAN